MKLIVGMLAVGFGYLLVYYGVQAYRNYNSSNPSESFIIPISALAGFDTTTTNDSSDATKNWIYASPPFTGWTS